MKSRNKQNPTHSTKRSSAITVRIFKKMGFCSVLLVLQRYKGSSQEAGVVDKVFQKQEF